MVKENKKIFTQEDIMKILDTCYYKAKNGIPNVSLSVEELANEYLNKYSSPEKACKEMIKNQILKCTTSGFITGFGGFIVMPVTIPANITSVLYVQMRMIACAAYMSGCDLNSDQTQTFVYACLAGVAVNELLKQTGIKLGVKLSNSLIKKIPGKTLTKINQKVGFRFITKFGSKGIINVGKLVPGVGAVVSGGFDFVETRTIGNRAYKWFFEGNCESDTKQDNDFIILEDVSMESIEKSTNVDNSLQ